MKTCKILAHEEQAQLNEIPRYHLLKLRTSLDLSDRFCANCGQLNTTKKLSFKDFFLEFFGGIFSYDSRMNRSLTTLIFHPGKISESYIKGVRTKYVNPFRFFLSIAILFFLVYSFSNGWFELCCNISR